MYKTESESAAVLRIMRQTVGNPVKRERLLRKLASAKKTVRK